MKYRVEGIFTKYRDDLYGIQGRLVEVKKEDVNYSLILREKRVVSLTVLAPTWIERS